MSRFYSKSRWTTYRTLGDSEPSMAIASSCNNELAKTMSRAMHRVEEICPDDGGMVNLPFDGWTWIPQMAVLVRNTNRKLEIT